MVKEEPDDLTPFEKYEAALRTQLGGRLTTIRKRHQQSTATLAERLDMRTTEIEDLEAGVGSLPLDAYMKVFFYLGHGLHCQVRALEAEWAKKRKEIAEERRLRREEEAALAKRASASLLDPVA